MLLVVTRSPDSPPYPELAIGHKGKIFGVCTALHLDGKTADLANPGMVQRYPLTVERWPHATPIDRMWVFDEPKVYDEFAGGELTEMARMRGGHMIRIPDGSVLDGEVRRWLSAASSKEVQVYCSPRTRAFRIVGGEA